MLFKLLLFFLLMNGCCLVRRVKCVSNESCSSSSTDLQTLPLVASGHHVETRDVKGRSFSISGLLTSFNKKTYLGIPLYFRLPIMEFIILLGLIILFLGIILHFVELKADFFEFRREHLAEEQRLLEEKALQFYEQSLKRPHRRRRPSFRKHIQEKRRKLRRRPQRPRYRKPMLKPIYQIPQVSNAPAPTNEPEEHGDKTPAVYHGFEPPPSEPAAMPPPDAEDDEDADEYSPPDDHLIPLRNVTPPMYGGKGGGYQQPMIPQYQHQMYPSNPNRMGIQLPPTNPINQQFRRRPPAMYPAASSPAFTSVPKLRPMFQNLAFQAPPSPVQLTPMYQRRPPPLTPPPLPPPPLQPQIRPPPPLQPQIRPPPLPLPPQVRPAYQSVARLPMYHRRPPPPSPLQPHTRPMYQSIPRPPVSASRQGQLFAPRAPMTPVNYLATRQRPGQRVASMSDTIKENADKSSQLTAQRGRPMGQMRLPVRPPL